LREDLFQEMQVAIWRSLPTFAASSSLRTWALRIALRSAIDHVRRNRRRCAKPWREWESIDDTPASEFTDQHVDEGLDLAASLQSLHPLDRQILALYIEGESAATIAEVTGHSPALVATKISRTKKTLAKRNEAKK
jgi:RNA polymerase sigma-70 factor (ECF subfamily)